MEKKKTKVILLNKEIKKQKYSTAQKGIEKRVSEIYLDSLKEIEALLERSNNR